ncbi:HipA domain-containing protein [Streptomyces sp. SID9124]|uniref:type II toxin-antitoxin system HipA family toxin n=1 Tax=Streptomyces sp. SID9124 TaxID=2706108 RepID=UPI0013DF7F02|nr:HipA domain-containing protein [Streptomyces sp. SID9124]NED12322.1 type II toxin-antitoxin system HipA family toxin [Streptomyces sp. SID9124]
MPLLEKFHAVLLYGTRIGTLHQRGDYTRFVFNETYLNSSQRPVLGLHFEENLTRPYAAALRLPQWFSNLLPEGPLREWIAQDRGVALDREMELLAQVGHDLPGAVQVMPAEGPDEAWEWPENSAGQLSGSGHIPIDSPWRFSLAGVALKLSMLDRGDRLTVPAAGEHGDWLVKFPDYRHADSPLNEYAMMSLARAVGVEVPEVRLLHRDELDRVPDRMWPNGEHWAYAVRRFDRVLNKSRTPVHIEDFAQVRNKYPGPHEKYQSSFETVAAIAYRGQDRNALREAARRIAFSVTIGNGDAHLKNWSLLYRDQRIPTLSPAYDLVSTVFYKPTDEPEDLGLKISGSKRFSAVRLKSFATLESRIDRRLGRSEADLEGIAADTISQVRMHWPDYKHLLAGNSALMNGIDDWIAAQTRSLLRIN